MKKHLMIVILIVIIKLFYHDDFYIYDYSKSQNRISPYIFLGLAQYLEIKDPLKKQNLI